MRKIKTLALSLCFVLTLGIVLNTASNILKKKNSMVHYSEFWDNPEEYDVWFMGSSHMYYAIQPMELWNQYGIRSYNLAAPSSPISQAYWTMMCALQYSQPEVIVLDTYKVHLNEKYTEEIKEVIHTGFDGIPLSIVKTKGICDIFDSCEDRFEYICGFSIYHNRWEELTKSDFDVQLSSTKGGRFKNKIVDNSDFQRIEKEEMSDTDTIGFLYLKKIIEECQKRGIKLILTGLPFYSTKEQQKGINAVSKLSEEYGVVYLDMAYEEGLIDFGMDFGDKHHVNLFGADKTTQYIGDYLSENCGLTDYRKIEKTAEKWNKDYESYQQLLLSKMRKAGAITSYVQWIKNDRYTCYMYQKKEATGLLARELAQLENITYISLEEAEARMKGKIEGEYAFFVESHAQKLLDKAVFKNGKRKD